MNIQILDAERKITDGRRYDLFVDGRKIASFNCREDEATTHILFEASVQAALAGLDAEEKERRKTHKPFETCEHCHWQQSCRNLGKCMAED